MTNRSWSWEAVRLMDTGSWNSRVPTVAHDGLAYFSIGKGPL